MLSYSTAQYTANSISGFFGLISRLHSKNYIKSDGNHAVFSNQLIGWQSCQILNSPKSILCRKMSLG